MNMKMNLEPTIYLIIASATGSLYYHLSGYRSKKKHNPDTRYSYNYMLQTIFVIICVTTGYSRPYIEWSHYNLLLAFFSGMGGSVGISKLFRGIKNKE